MAAPTGGWVCSRCQQTFPDWPALSAHIQGAQHIPLELCYITLSANESGCRCCGKKFPVTMLTGRNDLQQHSLQCDEPFLKALHVCKEFAYCCPSCRQPFDRWNKCLVHFITKPDHACGVSDNRKRLILALDARSGLPKPPPGVLHPPETPSPTAIDTGANLGAVTGYNCKACQASFKTDLPFLVHIMETGHVPPGSTDIMSQLRVCAVRETAPPRFGFGNSANAESKNAKEQKAYDIIVDAIHNSKTGFADPSMLRALQPLLPKGTLKKFVGRHSDTLVAVENKESKAGWLIGFAEGKTPTKSTTPAQTAGQTGRPLAESNPQQPQAPNPMQNREAQIAETGKLLVSFLNFFAKQTHTKTYTLAEPLSTQHVPIVQDQATKLGIFSHILAHRLIISKQTITAEEINRQAAQAEWLYDPKLVDINGPLREFLASNQPSLRTTNVPARIFRYLQDLSLAGCAFSVIRLPDSSVKVLKLAAADSGGILLKDFFSQANQSQRIIQLPQQQVTSEILKTEILAKDLKAAVNQMGNLPDPAPKKVGARKEGAGLPNPSARYPVQEEKVRKFRAIREQLPMWKHKEEFIKAYRNNRIVVLSGSTGSGKTTQLPQFVLDEGGLTRESPLVLCTQPRRIAAISVAERVAEERGQPVGNEVGYQVRFERSYGADTRLIFLTPGVLLRKLHEDPTLSGVGAIILDEVHERDVSTDFVTLVVKQVLLSGSTAAKVVLMSATLQADAFVNYFQDAVTTRDGDPAPIPVIRVEGRTHPVKDFFLEDALHWTGFELHSETMRLVASDRAPQKYDQVVAKQVDEFAQRMEIQGTKLVRQAVSQICTKLGKNYVLQKVLTVNPLEAINEIAFLVTCRLVYSDSSTSISSDVEVELTGSDDAKLKSVGRLQVLATTKVPRLNQESANIVEITGSTETVNQSFKDELLRKWRIVPKVHPELVTAIVEFFNASSVEGSILVFLPGISDMMSVEHSLLNCNSRDNLWVVKCHSGLPSQEQHLVFQNPPRGCRKVVLSTNLCESSITLPDVVFVIDSGLMKEKTYTATHSAGMLECTSVSQVNAIQRRGRAGRVRPGVCVHLFPSGAFSQLQAFPTPEMLRTPLEDLCLQVQAIGVPNVQAFLSLAMSPPPIENVNKAMELLEHLQCIQYGPEGNFEITPLGERLANFPVHPQLGRLLIVAGLMGCLGPCATIAASLSLKNPFAIPIDNQSAVRLREAKRRLSRVGPDDTVSDHLVLLNTYDSWAQRGPHEQAQFCNENCLNKSAISAIHYARMQLIDRVVGCLVGAPKEAALSFLNRKAGDIHLLMSLLGTALYPNVAFPQPGKGVHGNKAQQWYTRDGYSTRPTQESVIREYVSTGAQDTQEEGLKSEEFVVYFERVTSQGGIQLQEGTVVSAFPFLLAARKVEPDDAKGIVKVDDWLSLRPSKNVPASMLKLVNQGCTQVMYAFASRCSLQQLPKEFLDILARILSTDRVVRVNPIKRVEPEPATPGATVEFEDDKYVVTGFGGAPPAKKQKTEKPEEKKEENPKPEEDNKPQRWGGKSRLQMKLDAMSYPYPFDIQKVTISQLKKLVEWIEDTQIRFLSEEERVGLRTNTTADKWWVHLGTYFLGLGYKRPLPLPTFNGEFIVPDQSFKMALDWIVGRALRYYYTDGGAQRFNKGHIQYLNTNAPLHQPSGPRTDEPVKISVEPETTLAPLVKHLCSLLHIVPTEELDADLAICYRVVKSAVVSYHLATSYSATTPLGKHLLPELALGFTTGDSQVDDVCKILRLLHTEDLRDLQDKLDQTIVRIQNITGDPKTDSKLGKVGSGF